MSTSDRCLHEGNKTVLVKSWQAARGRMWRGGSTLRRAVEKGENPRLAGVFRTLRFWMMVSSIAFRDCRRNSVRDVSSQLFAIPEIDEQLCNHITFKCRCREAELRCHRRWIEDCCPTLYRHVLGIWPRRGRQLPRCPQKVNHKYYINKTK